MAQSISHPNHGTTAPRTTSDKNKAALSYARIMNGGNLPFSSALVTSYFPHKNEWNEDNLPDILFYLVPPKNINSTQTPQNITVFGKPLLDHGGRPIRDFDVLPRRISVNVDGWLLETWRRLDSRITYNDIRDRMVPDAAYGNGIGLVVPSNNSLQNHCRRDCRALLNNWTDWDKRGGETTRTDVETIEKLTSYNVACNTVLDVVTLWPQTAQEKHRLRKAKLVRNNHGRLSMEPIVVTTDNWMQTTYALDHFTRGLGAGVAGYVPLNEARLAAWELLLVLQERADTHGVQHWSELTKTCLPTSWFERTADKAVPNDTYDGGCQICTWRQ
ncbi:hypothetical protein LTR46_008863 [Exophiala xenobiotica]|nr:hypothetical protein LTR46_008863 [Exophiala xenobiotica]